MSVEPEIIERSSSEIGGALAAISKGELQTQIELAHMYPRDIKKFRNEALKLATMDEDTAAQCFYALPGRMDKRTGKKGPPIEGPSARLAEIVMSSWGNCHAGTRIIGEDGNFIVSQGVFRDLEKNVTVVFEARRRITTSDGRRFGDDMIAVTANACSSIALRNAVFKGVPKALWANIYEESRRTAIGDVKTMDAKRRDMVAYFGKMGVSQDRVLASIEKTSLDDIGPDELIVLKGIATALKDGELKVDDAFPAPAMKEPQRKKEQASDVDAMDAKKRNEELAARKTEKKETPPAEKKAEAKSEDPRTAHDKLLEQLCTDFDMTSTDMLEIVERKARPLMSAKEKRFDQMAEKNLGKLEAAVRAELTKKE